VEVCSEKTPASTAQATYTVDPSGYNLKKALRMMRSANKHLKENDYVFLI